MRSGKGLLSAEGWGGGQSQEKAKTSPPRQQLLPNMSQLVKEAEIEAVWEWKGVGRHARASEAM